MSTIKENSRSVATSSQDPIDLKAIVKVTQQKQKEVKVVNIMSTVLENSPTRNLSKVTQANLADQKSTTQHTLPKQISYKQIQMKTPKANIQGYRNFTPTKNVKVATKSPVQDNKRRNWQSTGQSKQNTSSKDSSQGSGPHILKAQSKFMIYDNSQQIFNIRDSTNKNMLFNQDKFQNPVNMLKNKFDIQSGSGGQIDSNESKGLFGHTPLGGATLTNHRFDKDGKPIMVTSNMKIMSQSDSNFELAPQQQNSGSNTNKLLNANSESATASATKFEHLNIATSPSKFPQNSQARQNKFKANNPIQEQMFETSFTYNTGGFNSGFQTGDHTHRVNTNNQTGFLSSPGNEKQNTGFAKTIAFANQTPSDASLFRTMQNTNQLNLGKHVQDSPIKRETKRGFGVYHKKAKAMIVFDQPLKAIGHHDLTQTSKTFIQGDGSNDHSQSHDERNKDQLFYEAFQQKMSNNVLNSRHDQIAKKRAEEANRINMPLEFLNRHPKQFKKYRNECKIVRQESQRMIENHQQVLHESLQPYLLMTPSQASSMYNPGFNHIDATGQILHGSSFDTRNTRNTNSTKQNSGGISKMINTTNITASYSPTGSEEELKNGTFVPTFAQFESDVSGQFVNKSSLEFNSNPTINYQNLSKKKDTNQLNLDSSANLMAVNNQNQFMQDQQHVQDILNRNKLITNAEDLNQAMLQQERFVGLQASYQREQIKKIVKEKNQINPFQAQRINQTSKTGFSDRSPHQDLDVYQKAYRTKDSIISDTDSRVKEHDSMNNTKESFIFNKRVSIEEQLENESKNPTIKATQSKQFPTRIGNDKVSSTIFTYNDMNKVFKRQINRIKMSSTIQAEKQTLASTTESSYKQNSKSVLNTPKGASVSMKKQKYRVMTNQSPDFQNATKHNLSMNIFEKTPRHHNMTIQQKQTSKWSGLPPVMSPMRAQIEQLKEESSSPFKDQQFLHTPHLMNTMLVNLNMGNLNPRPDKNEFYVQLGVIEKKAATDQEKGGFNSINQRQKNLITKYNDNLEKNEWKNLPFKVQKRVQMAASQDQNTQKLPRIHREGLHIRCGVPDAISFRPETLNDRSVISVERQSILNDKQSSVNRTNRRNLSKLSSKIHSNIQQSPEINSRMSMSKYSSKFNIVGDQTQITMNDTIRDNEFAEDVILEEEDLTDMQKFLISQEETRDKFNINEDAQTMIEMIDNILAEKKRIQTQNLMKMLLKSNKDGVSNLKKSLMSDMKSNVNTSVFNKSYAGQESSKDGSKERLERLEIEKQQSVNQVKIVVNESKAIKNLPILVQEVLAEQQAMNLGLATPPPKCQCNVRETLKEFIRYIRHYAPDLSGVKQKLKELNEHKVLTCAHQFQDDAKEERQLLMMAWYNKFLEQFEVGKVRRIKVAKPMIFKKFVKYVMQQENVSKTMLDLQNYIKKNNLMKGSVDFSNFSDFNRFLSMKKKKKQKLNIPIIEQFDLDDKSIDSSEDSQNETTEKTDLRFDLDRTNSVDSDSGRVSALQLYNPNDKFIKKHNNEIQDEITMSICKSITVNNKMYNNFIGLIVGEEPLNNLKNEPVNLEKLEEKKKQQVEQFEETLLSSLNHVIKTLKGLKKAVDDAAQMKEKRKYMQAQNIKVRKANKDVDYVLAALEKNLVDDLDAKEKEKTKHDKKVQAEQEKQKQALESQNSPMVAKESRKQSFKSLPIKVIDQTKTKQLASEANGIRIYDEAFQKQQFFQQAKRLIEHPTDPCIEKSPIMMSYYQNCQKKSIPSDPQFIHLIKNNMMMLRGQRLSIQQIECIKDIMAEGERTQEPSMQIHKLLIDDAGLNDKGISMILESLQRQENLRSITIMNCQMAEKSVEHLCTILRKPFPNHVEELRLHNIKGLGDLQSAKPEKGQKRSSEPLLANVLEDVSSQNSIKVLQLSGMSLDHQSVIKSICDMITLIDLNELDLSFARISLENLKQISFALNEKELENIQTLSLKGVNQLSIVPQEMEQYYNGSRPHNFKFEMIEEIIENLKEYLKKSISLQHIDLSQLELRDQLVDLVAAAKSNPVVIAMHLSGNHLNYDILEKICALISVNMKMVGPQIQEKTFVAELKDDDQIQGVINKDIEKLAKNQKPFDKRKVSESVAQRDNYTELNNMIQKEVKKSVHEQINDLLHMRNVGVQTSRGKVQIPNQLVLFRKQQHPDQIFTDSIQNINFRGFKPFDLGTINQRWNIRLKDEDCYVCQKFKYMKIFFRRSEAHKYFKKITKDDDIRQLRQDLNIERLQQKNNDPYGKLPLIFGSIFEGDQPCKRMLLAQHQAAIKWALEESSKRKGVDQNVKDRILRKLFKGIKEIMKQNISKVEKEDFTKINCTFAAWRDHVLPKDKCFPTDDDIINYPIFDASKAKPDEDDIYIYSGYITPGVHQITIFDPITDTFYKMDNIAVYPRVEDLKVSKKIDEFAHMDDEDEQREAAEYQGEHYRYIRQFLYGDLTKDYSNRVAEFACHYDLDPVFIDLKKFVKNEQLKEMSQIIQESYIQFLKVWKILSIECFDPEKLQVIVSKIQFANFMSKIIKQFQFLGCITLGDLDQTYEITLKTLRKNIPDHPFNRKAFLICMLRLAQLLSERKNQAGLDTHTSALASIVNTCFYEHIIFSEELKKDLQQLRKQHIFDNRLLSALIRGNIDFIKNKLFKTFLKIDNGSDGTNVIWEKYREEYNERVKMTDEANDGYNPDNYEFNVKPGRIIPEVIGNPGYYGYQKQFLFSSSLQLFQEQIFAEIPELASLNNYKVLIKLASQSQMTVVNEQISGEQKYKILSFEEFLLFLINCAVYWKLDWVNKEQSDIAAEEEAPVEAKQSSKKPLSKPSSKKVSKHKIEDEESQQSSDNQHIERPTLLFSQLTPLASQKNIARAVLSFMELIMTRIQRMEKLQEINPQISFDSSTQSELHIPNFNLIIEKSVAFKSKQIKEQDGGHNTQMSNDPDGSANGSSMSVRKGNKRKVDPDSSDYDHDSDFDEEFQQN